MKRNFLFSFFVFCFILPLFSQEVLKSTEEEYYDFLSLQGLVERPTLNYRTLSDSEWIINDEAAEDHPWKNNNLGKKYTLWESSNPVNNWFTKGINQNIKLKIYGPEWFNSYNTTAPYGQNDGALWQGRGYNTSLTSGARLEAFGFEITVKPVIGFSQNGEFEYITPNYSGESYSNKAEIYGYYGVTSIDSPQRFGDKPIFFIDLGDTEARWSLYNFTIGFGTQTPWLGPAKLNPIIHSNNAASYPKFDIGLRKTNLFMPHYGWYLGDLEFRCWWGKLSESDFFDNDDSNNNNLIAGFSAAYGFPGIFKGLSLGINRTMLSKWNDFSPYTLFNIFIPGMSNLTSGGSDASDQRFSLTVDYLLPKAGIELYVEWARNDFSPSLDFIIRYPFHTQGWTAGVEKTFTLPHNNGVQILVECTNLECSADYDRLINWYSTFYGHHMVTQGYTNKGQWLGAGIGTGGNSQYLGIKWIHSKGNLSFFMQRQNPDLDYTMYIDSRKYQEEFKNGNFVAEGNIRCNLIFGLDGIYYISKNLSLYGKYCLEIEKNPLNKSDENRNSVHRYNNIINIMGKYTF